jgi:hypothetical protein
MPRQILETFSPAEPSLTYSTLIPLLVQGDAEHHQRDARDVAGRGELAQHDRADDGSEHRQQRQHERERGPGQPRHGQLIGHVRDHRGAHADPGAGQQQDGVPERRESAAQAPRGDRGRGDQHRGAEPVDPCVSRAGVRHPVAEDHVDHEQGAVGEREDEPERLSGQADHGDRGDARRGEDEGPGVARRPRPRGGQDHRAEKLDRAHGRQRQPGHREVEGRVHQGQRHAEGHERRADPADRPPRPPPEREHQGRAGDPQPGHAQHADAGEQQHGQRRPQVVEDSAHREERLRRQPCGLRSSRHRRSI